MRTSTKIWTGMVAVLLLAFAPTAGAHNGNHGTIKVHDEMDADPDERNEPHVDCDFFIEGFNMDGSAGTLVFYVIPPTGSKAEVMNGTWSGQLEDDEDGHHFLAGPFTLPSGHYRVEAFSTEGHPGDHGHFAKAKTFWVACEEVPEDCPTPLSATANNDGSITVSIGATGVELFRAVGNGPFESLGNVEGDVYVDTDTEVGTTYSYAVDLEAEECMVQVTAIPVFPGAIALGLAVAIGAVGYIVGRRTN